MIECSEETRIYMKMSLFRLNNFSLHCVSLQILTTIPISSSTRQILQNYVRIFRIYIRPILIVFVVVLLRVHLPLAEMTYAQ